MVPMPSAGSTVPATVNDFVVLPLKIPPQPSFPQNATHYLYLRANAPKVPTENTPREVFLVNVPIDTTEQHIKSLFAVQLGGARVENVAFDGARVGKGIAAPVGPVKPQGKKRKRGDEACESAEEVGVLPEVWEREVRRSGGTAVVTFVDAASAQLALKEARRAAKRKNEVVWGARVKGVPALWSQRYAIHHELRYPDHAVLQQSVDTFMVAFAAQEEAKAKALARLRNEPDEDGFITVTRGGRQGPGREEEAKAKEEELKKREKSRVKEDFYRFQVREKKKAEAKDLVKGFEEDRRKVEELKRRRGRIRPE